jgi:hypothetical protein
MKGSIVFGVLVTVLIACGSAELYPQRSAPATWHAAAAPYLWA